MQAAEGIAKLFDFGFSNVLFVFSASELFGDFIKVTENSFQDFTNSFHLGLGLQNPGALLGRQLALTAALIFPLLRGVTSAAM